MMTAINPAEPDGQRSRGWRLALLAVVLLYIGMAIAQSILLPVFEGPDEQRHYAYVRYLVNNRALPSIEKASNDSGGMTYIIGQESGQPPLYYLLVALVTAPVANADNGQDFVQPNPFMTAYDSQGIRYDNHNRYLHGPERSAPWQGLSLAVHLGRLVSVLLGVLALLGVHAAAGEVSPERPLVALIATALVAFHPVFISLTSAVTNDAAVICFAALSTWAVLRIARRGVTLRIAMLGGFLAGLTALSKFNGVWIAGIVWLAIIGGLIIDKQRNATRRYDLAPLLASVGVWTLTVGWLYLHNYLTSGDPFGLAIHAIGDQSPVRVSQSALAHFAQHLGDLEITTWFASGWAELVPAPLWLLTTYRLAYGIGFIGALAAALQAWRYAGSLRRVDARAALQALCMGISLLLGLAGAIYWILVYMWSLGRLMYPALASAAVLVALGWGWWLNLIQSRWVPAPKTAPVSVLLNSGAYAPAAGWAIAIVLFGSLLRGGIGAVSTTALTLNPNPEITAPTARMTATHLTFLDPTDHTTPVASIIGYEITPQDLRSGGILYAKICWQSQGYTRHNYPYSIQLVGEGDVRPATRNSYHGLGSYPLTAWKPGEVFCDPTSLHISGSVDRPRAYKLVVTLYDTDTTTSDNSQTVNPLPVVDADNRPVYPVIGRVRIAPPRISARAPAPLAQFGDFAALVSAQVDAQAQPDSSTVLSVTLRWAAREPTFIHATVFMHVMDGSGKVVAQSDHQPDAGWFPTDYWQTDDVIDDHFEIRLPPGTRYEDTHLGVGMYDSKTMQRLSALDDASGQRASDDIVQLKK